MKKLTISAIALSFAAVATFATVSYFKDNSDFQYMSGDFDFAKKVFTYIGGDFDFVKKDFNYIAGDFDFAKNDFKYISGDFDYKSKA